MTRRVAVYDSFHAVEVSTRLKKRFSTNVGFFELLILRMGTSTAIRTAFFDDAWFRCVLTRNFCRPKPACGLGSVFFMSKERCAMPGFHWFFFI